MQMCVAVRPYGDADLEGVVSLFTASVHVLAAAHYDQLQRDAWAPREPDWSSWRGLLSTGTLVAESNGELLGFLTHDGTGYVKLLYVAPSAARAGVASRLLQVVTKTWITDGVMRSHTEASLAARPFFEHHGYHVVAEERVQRRGATFVRFRMECPLGERASAERAR